MVAVSGYPISELAGITTRVVIGGVLLLAGSAKARQRLQLAPMAHAIGMPPSRPISIGFRAIPVIELLIGLWLFLGWHVTVALGTTLLLFLGFTVMLIMLIRRGYRGTCACFGPMDAHSVGPVQLLRNAMLMAATIFALEASLHGAYSACAIWVIPLPILVIALLVLLVTAVLYALAAEVEALIRRSTQYLHSGPTEGESRA